MDITHTTGIGSVWEKHCDSPMDGPIRLVQSKRHIVSDIGKIDFPLKYSKARPFMVIMKGILVQPQGRTAVAQVNQTLLSRFQSDSFRALRMRRRLK